MVVVLAGYLFWAGLVAVAVLIHIPWLVVRMVVMLAGFFLRHSILLF